MTREESIKAATRDILRIAEMRLSTIHGKPVILTMELRDHSPQIQPGTIIKIVSSQTMVPVDVMKSHTRRREVAEARHIAMGLIREFCQTSYDQIGLIFNGRDHSTVIYAVKVAADLCEYDKYFNRKYNLCKQHVSMCIENLEALSQEASLV